MGIEDAMRGGPPLKLKVPAHSLLDIEEINPDGKFKHFSEETHSDKPGNCGGMRDCQLPEYLPVDWRLVRKDVLDEESPDQPPARPLLPNSLLPGVAGEAPFPDGPPPYFRYQSGTSNLVRDF